nr:kelch-like protein 22 [Ipomoea batatas]
MASATLNDKIFAIGGGNGHDCLSDVEMYDLQVGRWIPTRSMQKKRFALAGAELNGALYAVGGYDGSIYLKSAERFDPREHSWTKIKSMNTERGCHALVAMDGKLYVLFRLSLQCLPFVVLSKLVQQLCWGFLSLLTLISICIPMSPAN